MKRLTLLIALFVTAGAFAQDPRFDQFFALPFYLNPALTGSPIGSRVNLSTHVSMPNHPAGYMTNAAGFDHYFTDLNLGLGAYVINDQSANGVFKKQQLSVTYTYDLTLDHEWSARFGVESAFMLRSVDWTGLSFGDMIHERFGFIYETQQSTFGRRATRVDFSAGTVVHNDRLQFGLSMRHLNAPGVEKAPEYAWGYRKWTAHGGYTIQLDADRQQSRSIVTSAIMEYQGEAVYAALGGYFRHGHLQVGIWYRSTQSMVFIVGAGTDNFQLAYSHSLPLSGLRSVLNNGHELGIRWLIAHAERRRVPRQVPCPQF